MNIDDMPTPNRNCGHAEGTSDPTARHSDVNTSAISEDGAAFLDICVVEPRFQLGALVATPGALRALEQAGKSLMEYLLKHMVGDWGDVCTEDKRLNDDALTSGDRVLSAYRIDSSVTLWIITEADRSSTCALLPEEY